MHGPVQLDPHSSPVHLLPISDLFDPFRAVLSPFDRHFPLAPHPLGVLDQRGTDSALQSESGELAVAEGPKTELAAKAGGGGVLVPEGTVPSGGLIREEGTMAHGGGRGAEDGVAVGLKAKGNWDRKESKIGDRIEDRANPGKGHENFDPRTWNPLIVNFLTFTPNLFLAHPSLLDL